MCHMREFLFSRFVQLKSTTFCHGHFQLHRSPAHGPSSRSFRFPAYGPSRATCFLISRCMLPAASSTLTLLHHRRLPHTPAIVSAPSHHQASMLGCLADQILLFITLRIQSSHQEQSRASPSGSPHAQLKASYSCQVSSN